MKNKDFLKLVKSPMGPGSNAARKGEAASAEDKKYFGIAHLFHAGQVDPIQ